MIERGKKVLLFPVEITTRELDFRLVLAALCIRPDWQILVGEHEQLNRLSFRLRNALFVGKDLFGKKYPRKYALYREQKIRVIQVPEEGAIYEGRPENWKETIRLLNTMRDITQIEPDDYVCTWGRFQAGVFAEMNLKAPVHVVGHPRFDLCRPRFEALYNEEAEILRKRHGRFILINTNFLSNNAMGPDINFFWYGVRPEETERRTRFFDQYCYYAHKQADFIHLINQLSNEFPDHQIVFRPHPSEDIRLYHSLFQHIPRVLVTREGSLLAWLKSCGVLIHDGCTTAIEGYLSGANVINYQPLRDPRFDIVLPNLVGRSCTNPAEVSAAVSAALAGERIDELVDAALLGDMIANFGTDFDSFGTLTALIGKCQDETSPTTVKGQLPLHAYRRLTDPLARIIRPFPRLRRIFHSKDRGFEKFPPLCFDEVRRKLDIITRITGQPMRCKFRGSKIISLTSA